MAKDKKVERPMRLTDVEKRDILERVERGESPPSIAESIDRAYPTVLRFLKSEGRSKGRGRPPRTNAVAPAAAAAGSAPAVIRRIRQGATSNARLDEARRRFDEALADLLAAQAEVATDQLRARLSDLI